jgi:hypothetical protein
VAVPVLVFAGWTCEEFVFGLAVTHVALLDLIACACACALRLEVDVSFEEMAWQGVVEWGLEFGLRLDE